ncbi:MAG: signal recognition particle-docking protein FtsY [Dehalococcoidia bacterium]|nr:signal recognition particle-docking protein FtsY [Dehalococcoidia bacterium]
MLGLLKRNRQKNREKTQEGVQRSREGWLGRIVEVLRTPSVDDSMWDELEEILITADMGVDTSLNMIERLKAQVQQKRLNRPQEIFDALKEELVTSLAAGENADVWLEAERETLPFVILVVGVNGAGKTTSIAKLAYHFNEAGKKVLLGAADTFRAAAIDQLLVWGQRVGVDVVSHQPGADPGAVAYDAIQAGKARGADVVIIDTAGRLHTKSNLMEELRKVKRVMSHIDPSAPHQVILTLDATTGHNGLSQARTFTEAVECTGIFLAKLDGTARGGIVMAIKSELDLPILFIGTGENLQDMAPFDSREFVEAMLEPVPSPSRE